MNPKLPNTKVCFIKKLILFVFIYDTYFFAKGLIKSWPNFKFLPIINTTPENAKKYKGVVNILVFDP